MKAEKSKYKIFVPKNPRLNFAFEEVQTAYFRGYTDFLDGDDFIVNRNTRKEGYLVSYAYEYWSLGYEEPDFGDGDIATFSSFNRCEREPPRGFSPWDESDPI